MASEGMTVDEAIKITTDKIGVRFLTDPEARALNVLIKSARRISELRAALEHYAGEKNWTSNYYGNQTEFRFCKNGYDIAQAALAQDKSDRAG